MKIHPNFRFYCTCSFDKLNSISDKFLNRLTILFVEDQIKEINDDDKKLEGLIKMLMKQEIKTDNLPLKLINELVGFQKKNKFTISKLSKLTKCCFNLSSKFPDLNPKENIKYVIVLIGEGNEFYIPDCSQIYVNSILEKFIKKKKPKMKIFILDLQVLKI